MVVCTWGGRDIEENNNNNNDDDDDDKSGDAWPTTAGGRSNNCGDADEILATDINEDYFIGATSIDGCVDEGGEAEVIFHAPKLSAWKEEVIGPDNISLTVGKARCRLWAKGQFKIGILLANLESMRAESQESVPPSQTTLLYNELFGSKSVLCETFCRHIPVMTKLTYLQVMATFLTSCCSQMSLPIIQYSKMMKSSNLLSKEEYNKFWREVGEIGGTNCQEPFWMTVEAATNSVLKKLFLAGERDSRRTDYLVGLDDDKVHFNYAQTTKTQGLKKVHHVKDNRRGFTLHTAAFSAMCVPVCILFQREVESVQDTYLRILKSLFGERGENMPDLRGVTLASDRGYWKPSLIFQHCLESGANIEGTVQRVSG